MKFVILVLALVFPTATAEDIKPTLTADRTDLRLSESLQLWLTVEGPGPLRVELPAELLDDASAANWRLRPLGPAVVSDLPAGRQRWSQHLRADPYLAGDAVPLGLASFNVFIAGNAQPNRIEVQSLTIRVATGVKGETSEIRPPTGIEEFPALPSSSSPWERVVVAALGLAVVLAIAFVAWRVVRHRRPVPLTPEEWARRELDTLENSPPDGALFTERLSHIVRTYLERISGIPATRLTTSEFLTAIESTDGVTIPVDLVRSLLEWSDRVKFAGFLATDEERAQRLVEVHSLITPVAADAPSH